MTGRPPTVKGWYRAKPSYHAKKKNWTTPIPSVKTLAKKKIISPLDYTKEGRMRFGKALRQKLKWRLEL